MTAFEGSANENGHEHRCNNCGQKFSGNYCNNCGQLKAHRYTVPHVIHEAVHVFTHADKGIFPFIRDILHKPGLIAQDLVEGRRRRHFNLVQYLILITGFLMLLIAKTDILEGVANATNPNQANMPERIRAVQTAMLNFVKNYNQFVQFALLPISGLLSWLLMQRTKFNYAEHIIKMMAANAAVNTAMLPFLLVLYFISQEQGKWYLMLSVLILLFYYTLTFRQFHEYSWIKALFKSILLYVLFNMVQILLVMIVIIIYVVSTK